MRIIYQGVDLLILETREINFEAVYDDSGTDYLFTRVTVLVRALVNGQAAVVTQTAPNGPFISYDFVSREIAASPGPARTPSPFVLPVPIPPIAPGFPPGVTPITIPAAAGIDRGLLNVLPRGIARVPNAPPLTHGVIRHRLTTPRGKLYIFSGPGMESGAPPVGGAAPPVAPALLMLESPAFVQGAVLECDCKNGPIPHLIDIIEAVGDSQTFIVDWACETFIRDDQPNNVSPRGALLSNRFSQTHTVDDNGFTTVTTEGLAVFRTDQIYFNPESPDARRPIIFMPIPTPGFVRENIQVAGAPEANGIRYSYQDRQVPVNFVAAPYLNAAGTPGIQGRGAAKIAAIHRQAVTSNADILGGALSTYERVLGIMANRNFAQADPRAEEHDDKKALKILERAIGRGVRRALRGPARKPPAGG